MQTATEEIISEDQTITLRLGSGDRFRFEDENGCELALVEVGLNEDPQLFSVYTFGSGKTTGYISVFK